jgi:hypothetical protein
MTETLIEQIAQLLIALSVGGMVGTLVLGTLQYLIGSVTLLEVSVYFLSSLVIGLIGEFMLEPPSERMQRLRQR